MDAAAKTAEAAAEALDRGKLDEAQAKAGEAGELFRELAEQAAALVAKEQADRLAAAQQIASELARIQQDFKERLANSETTGGIDGQPQPEGSPTIGAGQKSSAGTTPSLVALAAARRLADKAESLADVLGVAARAERPQDQESAKKVEALVQSLGLKALSERLGQLPEQVRQGKLTDARAAADDGAERAEAAAERLAALRRSIVAPQVDELAQLEEQLAGLDKQLDELDSERKITGWHLEADQLLERLEGAGIEEELRQKFADEMRANGWSPGAVRRSWSWVRTGTWYSPPVAYHRELKKLATSVRQQIQELMLGDMTAAGDEPIPPQYQDLVDRYYQVLAAEKRRPPGKPREH
jgi:hypothetical protein